MKSLDVIYFIIAGGLLGVIGQFIRIIVGLKKLNDNQTKPQEGGVVEAFNINRLVLSIVIGFVAGAIALIIERPTGDYTTELIFIVIAAGYSGTDFIEGVFKTYLSKFSKPLTSSGSNSTLLKLESEKGKAEIVPDEARLNPIIVNG